MTALGTKIRPCWNAVRLNLARSTPPKLPARLGKIFTVDAISASPAPNGAVRIGGCVWIRSWVRVGASEEQQWEEHCAKIARDYPARYKPAQPWP